MFFWNDPKLPFDERTRAEFEKVVDEDRYTIYKVDGKLMVEARDHYTSQDLQGIIGCNYKAAEIHKFIEDGTICHFKDELSIPKDADEDTVKKIKAMFKRNGGNATLAFDLELLKKYWAVLFVDGAINEDNGDGTYSMDIARFIREHFNLSIDLNEEIGYHEYVVTMYERRKEELVEVSIHQGEATFAGDMDRMSFDSSWMTGPYVNIEVETYTMFRGELKKESAWVKIHERGFKPVKLGDAAIRPLTDELRDDLENRAQAMLDCIDESGVSFVHYEGEALVPFFFGPYPEYVNDRVIVDPVSLYTVNTSQYRSMIQDLGFDGDGAINLKQGFKANIDQDEKYMLFPYSFGYIFQTKKWAMLDLSNSREIKFRSDAIDKLVLEQAKKDMLLALVTNNVGENNDIVDGKGGGVITLLHGAPGLGKTLAAEVIAEYTEKPLYKVSVGELGTTPDELEERLSKILNIATRWGAVLLIDEADIFLEARTTNDIQRNAMVAIFLRLLEYYEGVLFLTTNRVANFDEAFYSRIMLSFGFGDFVTEARQKVWTNLLGNSNITVTPEEMITLNGYDNINARQIKNAINGARALAMSANEEVGVKHIRQLLDNTVEFLEAVKKN
ncbi:MAG: AAA family ATPase [Neptunomonas phycophila]|uniref:AAA family ATPase n=1 Tax=Neptunomonas phycophila TaxID=1572645 RepID=UPI003B8D0988